MKDTQWDKFLNWLYKAHALTKDWTPSKTSIELWEEYEKTKGEKRSRGYDSWYKARRGDR